MIEILLEIITNVLLMFLVLSVLFVLVISKIETNAYQGEIENQLHDSINKYLDQENTSTSGNLKSNLKLVLSKINIDKLIESEGSIGNKSQISNKWLFTLIYTCIGFLVAIFIIFCLTIQYIPGREFYLWRKVGWSLVIFGFVGVCEATFFIKIAKKFVPTPPSTLINAIVDQLKKW